MKNKILTTAFISAGLFLSQGGVTFAAITPTEVVTLVNQERSDAGLTPLTESALLDMAAQAKADDMASQHYFSHTSPDGVTPWDWFWLAKYEYRYAGENLAIHFHDAASEERAWMESRKHCENILSPKYQEIGVAVRKMIFDGKETTVAVQMFGTQMADENKVHLTEKGSVLCPKRYPSVLGTSMEGGMHTGIIGSVSAFLSDTAMHYKIDTLRLSLLILISIVQLSGLMVVFSLSTHGRWLKW
jgi:hypothetical protein